MLLQSGHWAFPKVLSEKKYVPDPSTTVVKWLVQPSCLCPVSIHAHFPPRLASYSQQKVKLKNEGSAQHWFVLIRVSPSLDVTGSSGWFKSRSKCF